jgi:hypothetical protein
MPNKCLTIFFIVILAAVAAAVNADMVILKSGEMFQTQRAWKENGSVHYYKNSQVVVVDESEVERLIHSEETVLDQPLPERPAAADLSKTPGSDSADQLLPVPFSADDTAGHHDLRWGQSLSQFHGLAPVATDPAYGGVQQFVKKTGEERFGMASVDKIVYGFWQGELYTITVWTSNFLDFKDLKAEAFRRFGEGIQNRDDVEKYYWVDQATDRLLDYDYDSDAGFLWMRFRALHEKVKARYPH